MKTYYGPFGNDMEITCIGGGTGLSTMLRGLKRYTKRLNAIVTVTDDGGGSGVLRSELGMLPPGDIRSCIQALANTEPTMEELLSYRFTSGSLQGQSFGNLFLAALNGMYGSFDKAVEKMCQVLAITGQVLPVTTENVYLEAEFENNTRVLGESKISAHKRESGCRIRSVSLVPAHPKALESSLEAIRRANLIILGPGSLYTSIIPNLLVDGVSEAIASSNAVKLYVCNIMTQDGETEQYSAADHIRAIHKHAGRKLVDICLANDAQLPPKLLEKYHAQGCGQIFATQAELDPLGVELYTAPVAEGSSGYARHDPYALARQIVNIFWQKSPTRLYQR